MAQEFQAQIVQLKAHGFDLITKLGEAENYIGKLEGTLGEVGKLLNVKRLGRSPDTRLDLQGIVDKLQSLLDETSTKDPM